MECVKTAFDDLCILDEEKTKGGRMEKRKHIDSDDEDDKFKSKNLEAERRRRKKLNDRLLELRSLMNKATIITDAVTYIEELQRHVKDLSDQLLKMDANCVKEEETTKIEETDAAEEMKKWGIEPEVRVTSIEGTKLWLKIVCQKTKGGFTKIMEAMSVLGFDLTDISVTTSKGAILVTSCVEGNQGGLPDVDQIKDFLSEIIKSI
ncbi:Transcription factor DYT1 [Forsythia ovata]|uniref:Transcription factor DYT1 n=1 Tax=Forsythia ovata TaxID=205694 RepID=A0ABD1S768_9LAMI